MPKINALVAGSTGYIGIQLIKLLVKHKYIVLFFVETLLWVNTSNSTINLYLNINYQKF